MLFAFPIFNGMELAGGMLMGLVLMFSLLAYNPSGISWLNGLIGEQTAGIGSAKIKVETKQTTPKKQAFALSSAAFSNWNMMPARYSCDRANISPPIFISGVPDKAQSLVLIMDDPDAVGGVWDHWVVFNIPPTVREIPEGKEPSGRAGANSWGKIGYGGPCPPSGEHRYVFRVYALNRTLPLRVGSSKAEVLADMKGYVLAEAQLVARYKRSK